MTLTGIVIKNIIRKLITGQDYRIEIVNLIDAEFLEYVIKFFRKVLDAKLKDETITADWYKREMINPNLPKEDIAINSGLNMKTISNMYNSATKQIVLDASTKHYDALYKIIEELTKQESVDITLTIKFRKTSVDLDINESLIVINTIAVKRAALRGGLWSTAGKQVEKPLMTTLCKIFDVPAACYDQTKLPTSMREVDFYLINGKEFNRCEVKLMGRGNPESADAVIARDSKVFVADKLSDLNKTQLTQLKVNWVELRGENGYRKFGDVLDALAIPNRPPSFDIESEIEKALSEIPDEAVEAMAEELVSDEPEQE
jgi:hypothetical protein